MTEKLWGHVAAASKTIACMYILEKESIGPKGGWRRRVPILCTPCISGQEQTQMEKTLRSLSCNSSLFFHETRVSTIYYKSQLQESHENTFSLPSTTWNKTTQGWGNLHKWAPKCEATPKGPEYSQDPSYLFVQILSLVKRAQFKRWLSQSKTSGRSPRWWKQMFPQETGIPAYLRTASIRAILHCPRPTTGLPSLPWCISTPLLSSRFPPERIQSHQQILPNAPASCPALFSELGLHDMVPVLTELAFLAFTSSISSCDSTTHKSWYQAGDWPPHSSPACPPGWPIINSNAPRPNWTFLTTLPLHFTSQFLPMTSLLISHPAPNFHDNRNGSYLLNMFQAHMLSYLTITTKLWGELHYRWEKGSSEKLINLPKITRLESSITRTQIQVYFQWAAGFFFFSVSRAPWVFLRLFQGSVRWKLCSR